MEKLTSSLSAFGWVAFVSVISYTLASGFTIPAEMSHFKFYALLGALVGFGIVNIFFARSTRQGWILLGSLVLGAASAAYYSFLLQTGATPGSFLYFGLVALLTVAFVAFGVALRTAGLSAEKSAGDPAKHE
jgi:peptidoglycan/LPS O-acetylase OafA/YrhL